MEPGYAPSLSEVITAALESAIDGLHTCIPGKIVKYYADRQTADVQPAVRIPVRQSDDSIAHIDLPTFPEVPVAWPRGGGFFVSFPLAAGDAVGLLFSEVAAGEYLLNGEIASPVDARKHSLGYPTAIPGAFKPDSKVIADGSSTALVIGKDGTDFQIHITGTDIELGKGATNFVALANLVLTELQAIRAQHNLHVHAVAAFGPSATPTVPMTAPNPVAATLVKAK